MENIEGGSLGAVRNSLPSSQPGSRLRDYLDSRLRVCLEQGRPWGHLDVVSVSFLKSYSPRRLEILPSLALRPTAAKR